MTESSRKFFCQRLLSRITPLNDLFVLLDIPQCFVAGGVFLEQFNDVDVYFPFKTDYETDFKTALSGIRNADILATTANAITVRYNNVVVQFCTYYKPTLAELVESFDFANTQIGIQLFCKTVSNLDRPVTQEIISEGDFYVYFSTLYATEAFKEFRMTNRSFYTGSEYPLSSLIRLYKYKRFFPGRSHIIPVLTVLVDVIERGFMDYEDFKDQLDAVDLGLVPAETEGAERVILYLYNLLTKGEKIESQN